MMIQRLIIECISKINLSYRLIIFAKLPMDVEVPPAMEKKIIDQFKEKFGYTPTPYQVKQNYVKIRGADK